MDPFPILSALTEDATFLDLEPLILVPVRVSPGNSLAVFFSDFGFLILNLF